MQLTAAKVFDGVHSRRLNRRHVLAVNLRMNLFIPEETMTPINLQGETRDVSVNGIGIIVPSLSDALYRRLLSNTRFVEIFLFPPKTERPIRLKGKVVWMDYHKPAGEGADCACYLGVCFDGMRNDEIQTYHELIGSLS
jgi:hypothetical protein